jgi:hypothetical protein
LLTGPGLALLGTLVVLLGVSGAVPQATTGEVTLSIDNAARSSTPNVQITGLYGGTGAGNVLLTNDHDQGYNANAQMPISSTSGTAESITGAYQTVLPNGQTRDINIPRSLQGVFVSGSTTQTASLTSWDGALSQVAMVDSRAGHSPIVVNGNLTLNANGSISITNASGTMWFGQDSWNDGENPLRDVLRWTGERFRLDLSTHGTIMVNGYNSSGSAAENRGLDIRANLTYEGVGAFVVNVAPGMENRGVWVEGEAKRVESNGTVVGAGSPVNVLASREGDGLAFVTNGLISVSQEGSFVPTVQGFLYAQGYQQGGGATRGIDILGGNLEGMAVGSRVNISSLNGSSGIVTDRIIINGQQTTMSIPPQMPGGLPVYSATVSNWQERP